MDLLRISRNVDDKEENIRIISTFAYFSLEAVVGVFKIVSERHSTNKASNPLPPVLLVGLCSKDTRC
jgi:hypothetical protein